MEILSGMINDVFTPCIDAVYARDGSITTFIGDAFFALFPDNCNNALCSALKIINVFKGNSNIQNKFGDFHLSVKIGISHGLIEWGIVGKKGLRSYYFKGNAIDNSSQAEKYCGPMEIIAHETIIKKLDKSIVHKKIFKSFFKITQGPAIKTMIVNQDVKTISDDIQRDFVPGLLLDNKTVPELRDILNIFLSFRDMDDTHVILDGFSSYVLDRANYWGGYFSRINFGDKGGNLLINFGIPRSFEDNVYRALNCIYEIREKYKGKIRAGITIGTIFAGFMGSTKRSAYDVIGNSVNLSARMAMKAKWGSILVSDTVFEFARQYFDSVYVGEHNFKGISNKIKLFSLEEKKAGHERLFGGKFYGRNAELNILSSFIRPVFNGKFAGLLFICGEAGIGKSRLVYEAMKRMDKKAEVCYLHCDGVIKKAWDPFINYLNILFRQNQNVGSGPNEASFEEIHGDLLHKLEGTKDARSIKVINELKRTSPFIKAMLSLDTSGTVYDTLEAKARYENTIYAVKELFKALAILRPTIIHIDDLHNIDADSVKLLSHITINIENYPLAFLLTGRHNDVKNFPGIEGPKNPIQEIELKRLSNRSAKFLIKHLLGQKTEKDLIEFTFSKSQNNPLFIEQFCRYIKESTNDIHNENYKTDQLPLKINQIFIARIDRLSKNLNEIVKIASVLGHEFHRDILYRTVSKLNEMIEGRDTDFFDKNALSDILKMDRHLLLIQGIDENLWHSIDGVRYIFKHSVLCDAAYNIQLRERLRTLHKSAGATFEEMFNTKVLKNDSLLDLAYHFEKAGIDEKTEVYLEKAASYLKSIYDNRNAMRLYRSLLKYTRDKEKEAEILMTIGEIELLTGNTDNADKIFKSVMELDVSDNIIAESYRHIGRTEHLRSNYQISLEYYKKALKIYDRIGNTTGIAYIYGSIGNIMLDTGKFDKALEHQQNMFQLLKKADHSIGMAIATVNIGNVYVRQGNYEKAIEWFESHIEHFRSLNYKTQLGFATGNLGIAYFCLGNFKKALHYMQIDRDIAAETGHKSRFATVNVHIGVIYNALEMPRQAIKYYDIATGIFEDIGDKHGIGFTLGNTGNVYYILNQFNIALEYFHKALNIFTNIGYLSGIASANGNIGAVYHALGSYDQAIVYINKQMEIAENIGDKISLAKSSGNLSAVLFDMNDHAGALKHSENAIRAYTEHSPENPDLCELLLIKARTLIETHDLLEAENTLKIANSLAKKIKNRKFIFESMLLANKLLANKDKIKAGEGMIKILSEAKDRGQKAEIHYELFLLFQSNEYRKKAIRDYKILYQDTKIYRYRMRMLELKCFHQPFIK